MKKAVFSDLDGTLLNNKHKFSNYTKKVLIYVQKQDVPVVLTTGRLASDAIRQAKKIKVNKFGGYVISNNGALAYSFKTNNYLWEMYLTHEEILKIFDFTFNKYKIHFFSDKSIYVYNKGKNSYYWSKIMKIDYNIISNVNQITEPITHASLITYDKLLDYQAKKLVKKIEELLPNLQVTQYNNRVFEIISKGISKGSALKFLSHHLQIPYENTFSFGDSYNDFELIKMAGKGIVVSNAIAELKQVTPYVVESNEENGPAQYLVKHILENKI